MTEQTPVKKVDPETLVLRAKPRRIIRIKRNLLIALAGGGCVCVAALVWLGLNPLAFQPVAVASSDKDPEKYKTSLPDQVVALPKSYDQTPVLGEKLPGDLGRPILEHQRAHGIATGEGAPIGKIASRADDVRTSGLFFQVGATAGGERFSISSTSTSSADQTLMALSSLSASASASPASGGSGQAEKTGFLQGASRDGAVDRHRVQAPASVNMVMAGTVIRASLITGLNSDLPGFVLAQVTSDVTDSRTGRLVLIPQGARLIGKYDSTIAFGQSRALVVWQRILWPDGRSLEIDNTPATDIGGYVGLTDRVDFHTASLLKGIGLSTLLGMSDDLGRNSDDDLVEALRRSVQETANQAGQKIVTRQLDVAPTLKIRPGWPLRIVVQKDLIINPDIEGIDHDRY